MAPSLVSAPIQHSSQRSSPFPAYQAGPPTASPPRRAPSHAARQVSATKAEDVPHIKSPPIVGPSSGPARSDPPTSLPAKEVASALPSSSTSSFSVHPPQADARAHPTAAAKREKRRLKTAAKREKARSAAATTATAVDGAASAPVSKVVSSSVATKAARIKAPAGTSVEVREVLRWSSSSSPAPLSDELADGPAASFTSALRRFPSSSSSRSLPSSSASPPPPPGMSASMTTTVDAGELDNGPRTPPPPPASTLGQAAGGLVGELLDADELRKLRRKEKTARQKAAKKALAAAASQDISAAPASAPAALGPNQQPIAGAALAPKLKPLPPKVALKAKATAATGAAPAPLHISLPTQASPRSAADATSSASSSLPSPTVSTVTVPHTGYRPEPIAPAAVAYAKQRFSPRKKQPAIVVKLPPSRLARSSTPASSSPSSLDEEQVRLKPPVRRHSPSPLRIVSPKPIHQAPIALLRPPYHSSPSAAGSVSSRAGSTASYQAGLQSSVGVGAGGGEYAHSFNGGVAAEDGGLGVPESMAIHPNSQQSHYLDSVGRFDSYPFAHQQHQQQQQTYYPPPPSQMVDWQQHQNQQHQASEPTYAYHPHVEYLGAYALAPPSPYGLAAPSSAGHLAHHPQPPHGYVPAFHPHHLRPFSPASLQQHQPSQHANVLLPPGYTADGGVYWDPATGQPYLYAYPTPPVPSAVPPPPPSGPPSLPSVDGTAFIQQHQPQPPLALPPFPPPPPTVTLSQPLPLHLAKQPAFVPRQQAVVRSPSPPAAEFDPARALGSGGQVYYV